MKAIWKFQDTLFVVGTVPDKQLKHKGQIKRFSLEEFFMHIMDYDTKLLLSIRDGQLVKDEYNIIGVIRKNIQNGIVLGTKEMLLRKLMNIRESMREVERIKKDMFDNTYTSCLEAAQAGLMAKGQSILVPRKVPELLEKHLLNKGLEKTQVGYCREIIEEYKKVEHGKGILPEGRKLDELARKCQLFREAVKKVKA
jgi:hypothetical protein